LDGEINEKTRLTGVSDLYVKYTAATNSARDLDDASHCQCAFELVTGRDSNRGSITTTYGFRSDLKWSQEDPSQLTSGAGTVSYELID